MALHQVFFRYVSRSFQNCDNLVSLVFTCALSHTPYIGTEAMKKRNFTNTSLFLPVQFGHIPTEDRIFVLILFLPTIWCALYSQGALQSCRALKIRLPLTVPLTFALKWKMKQTKNKNNKVHGPCAFHLVRSLNTQKTRYACTPRQNQQLQFSINYDF